MNLTSIAFPKFSAFMLGLTVFYILALLTGSTVLTFKWVYPCMQGKEFYIGLVFGTVASVAPWSSLALKDRNNVFFSGMVLMMQIATAVMALAGVVWLKWPLEMPMYNNAALLFGTMAVLVIAQGIYEKKHPEEKDALFGGNAQRVGAPDAPVEKTGADTAEKTQDSVAGSDGAAPPETGK
jgi:hypothetical protein